MGIGQLQIFQNMGTVCTDLKKIDIKSVIANGQSKVRAFTFTKMLKKSRLSTVWLAKNDKLKTFCAVKITKKVQARRNNCIQTTINEQTILQSINHPLIVNAIGTFQDLSNLYIVLEYMPYGSLRDYMNISGTLTQSQIRFVLICVLISTQYLHKHHIAHLDIKPENILIDQFGYFRLCDFNLSIDFNKKGKRTLLSGTGTYGYQAPQIYQDETLIGISSDLYSIGVVGVQMLTGFRRRNSKTYATQYLKDLLKGRKNVSEDCINFISRLLEDVPSNRIGAGGNFDQIWKHPWLYVCPTQKLQYQCKSIPSFIHDQYRKYIAEYAKQNGPNSSSSDDEQNDELLNKAMLEDKKFQSLFLHFRTIEQKNPLL